MDNYIHDCLLIFEGTLSAPQKGLYFNDWIPENFLIVFNPSIILR